MVDTITVRTSITRSREYRSMIGRFRFLVIICLLLVAATAVEAQSANDYARAEALVREGQFAQGVTLLTRILAREPRNFQAYNLMGIALTGEGKLATANTKYQIGRAS